MLVLAEQHRTQEFRFLADFQSYIDPLAVQLLQLLVGRSTSLGQARYFCINLIIGEAVFIDSEFAAHQMMGLPDGNPVHDALARQGQGHGSFRDGTGTARSRSR